jgi:hypothetical protein
MSRGKMPFKSIFLKEQQRAGVVCGFTFKRLCGIIK